MITVERLKELFRYEEGKLVNTIGRRRARKGEEAGARNSEGYVLVMIEGKRYLRSHLIWLWHKDVWPLGQLDHRNGVRHDDRIENLRDVSAQVNNLNRPGYGKYPKGAYRHSRGYFFSQIKHEGSWVYLGRFATAEAAHEAFIKASYELRGETIL